MSGKVSVVSDHAAIEGRYLDFYLGEWANDSALVCGTLSKMSLTLIYIRQSLVAQGTSLKHLKWQVLILCNTVLLILSSAFQREDRFMARSSTSERSLLLWSCRSRRYRLFGVSSYFSENDLLTRL